MLNTKNTFTPQGAQYSIHIKQRKIRELIESRKDFMHKTKDSHPAYANLTDKEFHDKKVAYHRWVKKEIIRIENEIKELQNWK